MTKNSFSMYNDNVFQYICCAKVDENNDFTQKYQRIHIIWVPYKLTFYRMKYLFGAMIGNKLGRRNIAVFFR